MFRIIGDLAGPNFFSINETNGVISVRNNLELDSSQNYTLRVQVKSLDLLVRDSSTMMYAV